MASGADQPKADTIAAQKRALLKAKMRTLLEAKDVLTEPRSTHHDGTLRSLPRVVPVGVRSLPCELWAAPLGCLDLCTRVSLRAVSSSFVAAISEANAGQHTLEICGGVPLRLDGMVKSAIGKALFGSLRELRFVGLRSDPESTALTMWLPSTPLLEVLEVSCCRLVTFEAVGCPSLSAFIFDWSTTSCLLRRFCLVTGSCFTTVDGVEPNTDGMCLDVFRLDCPGLQGTLNLSGLGGATELAVRCSSPLLQVSLPERAILRRVQCLDLHLAADATFEAGRRRGAHDIGLGDLGHKALILDYFTGLRELTVCSQSSRIRLPEATQLSTLLLDVPSVTALDLSEWTAFGELIKLELRNCHRLAELRLPYSGELRKVKLHIGGNVPELRLHVKAFEDFDLHVAKLQRLSLSGGRGLEDGLTIEKALSGCPALEEVVLCQLSDLKYFELGYNADPHSQIRTLNLEGMSRVNKLTTLRIALPLLSRLSLPPAPMTDHTGIKILVLVCPHLTSLDLRSLNWQYLEELCIESAALVTLYPPKPCTIIGAAEVDGRVQQVVRISANRLSVLDLSGAQHLAKVSLRFTIQGTCVRWPRRHSGTVPIDLELAMPGVETPLPPPSAIDERISFVNLSGCHALSPEAVAAAIRRWPRLLFLHLDDDSTAGWKCSDFTQLLQAPSANLEIAISGRRLPVALPADEVAASSATSQHLNATVEEQPVGSKGGGDYKWREDAPRKRRSLLQKLMFGSSLTFAMVAVMALIRKNFGTPRKYVSA